MDIASLQFSTNYTQQLMEQTQLEQTKDFDKVLNQAMAKEDDKALKEACVELESYMLSMLMKQMKSSCLSEESLIPKGDYEKMFEDTQITAQCESMAKAGGIGLANMLYKQIKTSYGAQAQASQQITKIEEKA